MNDRPDEFTPYWLQTAVPSTGEMPGQPVMFPWEYPWPHTSPRDMWADSTASNPFVPSSAPAFAPPAPSGANEQPPSHGFYVPPVPQAPSWDQVPADASMTGMGQGLGQGLLDHGLSGHGLSSHGLGQLFPQPPGGASWLASAPGASYSSADEALMAADARRVAADRLKRGMQRTIPTAPPPEHLSPSNPLVHGFYLSPVGPAPSWEQVVPTATPWSVAPKLPSPTAWGDTISGPECHTSGGKLTCITPGGKQVTVPAEGLDDELKIAPGHPNYHYYNTSARSYPGDPRSHMGGIINEPTPGPSFLVRPATPEGTRNEAAPWYVHLLRRDPLEFFSEGIARWPVKSYSTTDQNGARVVVNVTQPGHPLYPGVVMRYETTSPSGSTIHNEGTGLGWVQGPSPPATPRGSPIPDYVRDWANDYIWRRQSEDIMGVGRHRPKGLPLGG